MSDPVAITVAYPETQIATIVINVGPAGQGGGGSMTRAEIVALIETGPLPVGDAVLDGEAATYAQAYNLANTAANNVYDAAVAAAGDIADAAVTEARVRTALAALTADPDFNARKLANIAAATLSTDAVRLGQVPSDPAANVAGLRTLSNTSTSACAGDDSRLPSIIGGPASTVTFGDSASNGTGTAVAIAGHTHAMAAVPGSGSELIARSSASALQAITNAVYESARIGLVAETTAATEVASRAILQAFRTDANAPIHPAVVTPGRQIRRLQDAHANRYTSIWAGAVAGGATMSSFGWLVPLNTTAGTWSQVAPSSGIVTQFPAVRSTSSGTAGNVGGTFGDKTVVYRGDAAGRGGFEVVFVVKLSAVTSGGRGFVGLSTAVARTIHSTNPSALLNFIAFAFDASQTTWRVMHNDGAGTATTLVDLGSNFPTTSTTATFRFTLSAAANATTFSYRAERIDTSVTAQSGVSGTSDLIANTTFMTPKIEVGNGADTAAVSIDIFEMVLDHGTMPLAA